MNLKLLLEKQFLLESKLDFLNYKINNIIDLDTTLKDFKLFYKLTELRSFILNNEYLKSSTYVKSDIQLIEEKIKQLFDKYYEPFMEGIYYFLIFHGYKNNAQLYLQDLTRNINFKYFEGKKHQSKLFYDFMIILKNEIGLNFNDESINNIISICFNKFKNSNAIAEIFPSFGLGTILKNKNIFINLVRKYHLEHVFKILTDEEKQANINYAKLLSRKSIDENFIFINLKKLIKKVLEIQNIEFNIDNIDKNIVNKYYRIVENNKDDNIDIYDFGDLLDYINDEYDLDIDVILENNEEKFYEDFKNSLLDKIFEDYTIDSELFEQEKDIFHAYLSSLLNLNNKNIDNDLQSKFIIELAQELYKVKAFKREKLDDSYKKIYELSYKTYQNATNKTNKINIIIAILDSFIHLEHNSGSIFDYVMYSINFKENKPFDFFKNNSIEWNQKIKTLHDEQFNQEMKEIKNIYLHKGGS